MKCVVLSGGGGLRLWPLSRKKYPKQFLKLGEKFTMFQETVLRNKCFSESFLIITNDEFRFIIENQMKGIDISNYRNIFESVGRNTAPAITVASLLSDPDEILFVVPSDAKIVSGELYEDAIIQAETLAEQGYIVTFGITPDSPNTGYGYIRYNENDVEEFKEKPDIELAKSYLKQGNYLWNSGMFMFKASVFLEEIKKYRKDIYDTCLVLCNDVDKTTDALLQKEKMMEVPSESVDFAVMEKSDKVKVVKSDFYWNDVGGFEALCSTIEKDNARNGTRGNHIIMNKVENVSVINEAANKLIIVNDMKDAIIVNTNDAIYITKEGSSSDIKGIIEDNKDRYGDFFGSTIKNHRPWGYYEVLINNEGYKVKKITIYPNKRLSLQKHFFRSEHWTVVEGVATITLGKSIAEFKANESAYIPIGEVHRVENKTEQAISIIEVAIGDRIDEEDIVRIEDDYGR